MLELHEHSSDEELISYHQITFVIVSVACIVVSIITYNGMLKLLPEVLRRR